MSIKKSISFTFSAQIINTVIAFASSIIITRILGAYGRGENIIFINAIAFAVLFFGLSINSTIPYFINSGKIKVEELFNTIMLFIVISTVFVFFCLIILERLKVLEWALPNSLQSLHYKLIFTGIYFTTLVSSVLSTYITTSKFFKQISIFGITVQLLSLLSYFLIYLNVFPLDKINPIKTVINISFVLSLISTIILLIVFFKLFSFQFTKNIIEFKLLKKFALFSSLAYFANIFQFFAYKLDFWFIDSYTSKMELGVYSLATQLSQLLWILPQAIAGVLYIYASSNNEKEAIRYTIKLKQLVVVLSLIFAVSGLILGYFYIPIIYGSDFKNTVNLMIWFMIGVIPFGVTTIIASLFAARGEFKINFILSTIMFLISAILYTLLIPKYGTIGGAIASSLSYLVGSIICEVWFCKKYNIKFATLFSFNKDIFSISGILKQIKR